MSEIVKHLEKLQEAFIAERSAKEKAEAECATLKKNQEIKSNLLRQLHEAQDFIEALRVLLEAFDVYEGPRERPLRGLRCAGGAGGIGCGRGGDEWMRPKPTDMEYLGDSVYIGRINGALAIWTVNGNSSENTICIEDCLDELVRYLAREELIAVSIRGTNEKFIKVKKVEMIE